MRFYESQILERVGFDFYCNEVIRVPAHRLTYIRDCTLPGSHRQGSTLWFQRILCFLNDRFSFKLLPYSKHILH